MKLRNGCENVSRVDVAAVVANGEDCVLICGVSAATEADSAFGVSGGFGLMIGGAGMRAAIVCGTTEAATMGRAGAAESGRTEMF